MAMENVHHSASPAKEMLNDGPVEVVMTSTLVKLVVMIAMVMTKRGVRHPVPMATMSRLFSSSGSQPGGTSQRTRAAPRGRRSMPGRRM